VNQLIQKNIYLYYLFTFLKTEIAVLGGKKPKTEPSLKFPNRRITNMCCLCCVHQAFLSTFVDESVSLNQARHSTSAEDDNPPSPVGMDTTTIDSLGIFPPVQYGGNSVNPPPMAGRPGAMMRGDMVGVFII